jgi:predicted dehydrogenase
VANGVSLDRLKVETIMSKLRLIQCGVGGFGEHWLKTFTSTSPDFEVVAIVDLSAAALEKAGEAHGIAQRFTSLEDAVAKVKADAVLTITPPVVHIAHARIALGNGLHFMTEKPIADTIEHALEMVELAKANGRQLVVSQQYRFNPAMQKMKELIAQGEIGELGHGHLDFYIPSDFTGTFREKMEFPLLLDMAIHHVDLIRAVTGRNVVKVTAYSFNPSWSWYQHDAALKMFLELEGSVFFSYSGDWSAVGRTTSWNGTWRLQGSKGSLHAEEEKVSLARCERWSKNPTVQEIISPSLVRTGQEQTLHDFAEAIRGGTPAETSGTANLNSFFTIIAAMKSVKEGRSVTIAELSHS